MTNTKKTTNKEKKDENRKEKIEEMGEKLFEKAQEFVQEDIEEKLEIFSKNKFIGKFEKLPFIKGILKSACLDEIMQKLGKNKELLFKILGRTSIILGSRGVLSIFGHRHIFLPMLFFMLGGTVCIIQGIGLLANKKRITSIILSNLLLQIIFTIIILIIYGRRIFGSIGNTLRIFFILLIITIFVLKNKKIFSK